MAKPLKDRFKILPINMSSQLIVDCETGVEYYRNGVYTVLLVDAEGKPKINQDWKNNRLK